MRKKTGKNVRNPAKVARDAKILEMTMQGKKGPEICDTLGIARSTVSTVLNSNEVKALLKQTENEIYAMVPLAVKTMKDAMQMARLDMTNAVKVSMGILKSIGAIRDKIDLEHSFPKPTIIRRPNGEEVILGAARPDDEDYVA